MSSNIQNVRKRLSDLKNLSSTLKQKTEQNSTIDYSLIKQILYMAKANSQQNGNSNGFNEKNQQNTGSNLFTNLLGPAQANQASLYKRDSDYLPTFTANEKSNNGQQNNLTLLFADKSRRQYSSIARFNNGKIQSDPQEIIHNLQKQKQELEQQLLSLKGQIRQLQQQAQKNKQESWKQGIPFFSLDQDINVFTTKLNVSQKDYDKIDYTLTRVILDIDNISIFKKGKDFSKKLDVNQLRQVFYLGDTNMILYFKTINEAQEKLFLSFQNTQDLHRWDLGIFINFKIAQSLQKDRLFDGDLEFGYEKTEHQFFYQNNNIKNQERLSAKMDQSRVQNSVFSQQREQIQESQKISNSLRESQHKSKSIQKQKASSLQKANSSNSKSRKQSQNKSNKEDQKSLQNKRGNSDQDSSQIKQIQEKEDQRSIQNIQDKTQRQETSQFKLLSDNKNNIQQQKFQEKKLSPPPNLTQQVTVSSNQKEQKLLRAKQNLKNGYNLTKYAQGGWNPRQKRVYLSLDERSIIFQDIQKSKDKKKYSLSSIQQIQYRKIGPGIKKHIEEKKIIPDRFVSMTVDNKRIELGHSNILFISQFVNDLIIVSQRHQAMKNK